MPVAWYDEGGEDGATIIVVVLLQRRGPSPPPPDDDDDVECDVVLFLREEARMGDAFMVMGRPFRVMRSDRSARQENKREHLTELILNARS